MKKRIFMLVALMACIATANAQWYVGGTAGFTSTKVDFGGSDQSGTSFKIIPEIGYKVDDAFSVGVQVGYAHGLAAFGSLTVSDLKGIVTTAASAATDLAEEDMKLNSFTIQPYLRYNVVNFGKAKLFLEGYVGYTNINMKDESGSSKVADETKINAFELGIRPSVSISLSDKLDVVGKIGTLGFLSAKESESDVSLTRFGLDVDSYNVLVGFNFHF